MKHEFEVTTKYTPDGIIVQELFSLHDGISEPITRRVMDTQEQQTREALIALGWTPPTP